MLRDVNTQILHWLQTSLTNASLIGFSVSSFTSLDETGKSFLPLHQVFVCRTYILPQLYQFWTQLQSEICHKEPYQQANIGGLRLWLPKLQAEDQEVRKIREQGLKEGWKENADRVLCHQGLLFVPEIIQTELINRHHDDPLVTTLVSKRLGN